jgi:hypothetical protein
MNNKRVKMVAERAAQHLQPGEQIEITSYANVNSATGRPGKLLFTLPREAVAVAGVNKGLIAVKVELAIAGQDKGLRLAFPTIARKDGEQVAAALQAAPVRA